MSSNGRPPLYPWEAWLGMAGVHVLQPGIDFESRVDVKSLRNQIFNKASKRGVKVSTRLEGGSLILTTYGMSTEKDMDFLFDGELHELKYDVDFHGVVVDMQQKLLREAHRRNRVLIINFNIETRIMRVRVKPELDSADV